MTARNRRAAKAKFALPADPGEADMLAGELGELVTAHEWKRAAIVYARVRVEDGPGGDPATRAKARNDIGDKRVTPTEFALLGIHGLKSRTTIRRYWQCWDDAITEGLAIPATLGGEVELPDAEWADYYTPPQRHTTPPYYCPDTNVGERLEGEVYIHDLSLVTSCDEPLGDCPPLASDLDDDELSDEYGANRNTLTIVSSEADESNEDGRCHEWAIEDERKHDFIQAQSKIGHAAVFLERATHILNGIELTSEQRADVAKSLDEVVNMVDLARQHT